MPFIVPDDILEELICGYCHKYLSVGPVKVDRNRKKICGRCSIHHPDAVVSFYRFFLEHALFKCINRFNGCNVLLKPDEVFLHEAMCRQKKFYGCCKKKIPIHEVIYHCRTEHGLSLLNSTFFKRRLEDLSTSELCLFSKDNYLFFLEIVIDSFRSVVRLRSCYIGGQNRKIDVQQKFYLQLEGQYLFGIYDTSCQHLSETAKFIDTINVAHYPRSNYLIVHFEFCVPSIVMQFGNRNFLFETPLLQKSKKIKNQVLIPSPRKLFLG